MPIIAQRNWRWCSKCQGLWYSAATANPNGICPGGGGHSRARSGDYALYLDPDGTFFVDTPGPARVALVQQVPGPLVLGGNGESRRRLCCRRLARQIG